MEKKRGSFTGQIGFVLAAAGSAVGLGNLWRFPYLAAEYGGGSFIFVYIILALTFGFALLVTEIAMGRKTKKSPMIAYGMFHKKFKFVGYLACLVPVIILPYYCVIGGWVIKYMTVYLTGQTQAAAQSSFFGGFVGDTAAPLIFFWVFLLATFGIVVAGVDKGIEKASRILMPILLVLMVAICIYIATLPNALDGIKYYLLPNFSNLSFKTVCVAMGQLFFSMSLAMGIMVTYGSYTSDDVNLVKSVNYIEIFDTVVALLAGMMVVPAVYISSGGVESMTKGPSLMFVSLPAIFGDMPGGTIVGLAFFVLVLFAALTSSVSVMEAIVSCVMDRLHLKRTTAAIVVMVFSAILGIPSSLGFGVWSGVTPLGMDFLTFFDYVSNSVLMPIVALLTCIMIGWICGTKVISDEVSKNGEKFGRKKLFEFMIKYICPIMMIIILVFYTMEAFGLITV